MRRTGKGNFQILPQTSKQLIYSECTAVPSFGHLDLLLPSLLTLQCLSNLQREKFRLSSKSVKNERPAKIKKKKYLHVEEAAAAVWGSDRNCGLLGKPGLSMEISWRAFASSRSLGS